MHPVRGETALDMGVAALDMGVAALDGDAEQAEGVQERDEQFPAPVARLGGPHVLGVAPFGDATAPPHEVAEMSVVMSG
jgi:hypothetical protein